jgi:hypothetical protein
MEWRFTDRRVAPIAESNVSKRQFEELDQNGVRHKTVYAASSRERQPNAYNI